MLKITATIIALGLLISCTDAARDHKSETQTQAPEAVTMQEKIDSIRDSQEQCLSSGRALSDCQSESKSLCRIAKIPDGQCKNIASSK